MNLKYRSAKLVVSIFSLSLLSTAQLSAQSVHVSDPSSISATPQSKTADSDRLENGKNEFSLWGGGSFHSSTLIGATEHAKLGIFAVRYARVLHAGDIVAIKYVLDGIPAAVLSFPDVFNPTIRSSVYGGGVSPIGFQANFRPKKNVQPFVETSGGFLYFKDPIPNFLGAQFNFTFDFGGGAQIFTGNHHALTFGYKYHHISNGSRGIINPGFDSNLFYAGFSIFR